MLSVTGFRIAAVLMAGLLCMGGCRAVLGIDNDRPALGHEVPDASAEDGDDAGRQGYCSTLSPAAQRCVDFEEGDLFAGWDNEATTPNPGAIGGGIFEELLEPDGRKLLARLPALVGSGQHANAILLYSLASLPPRVSVYARLNVVTEDIPGTQELALMSIVFEDEGAVVVYRDRMGAAVAVVPDGKAARFPAWPVGAAHRISISVANGKSTLGEGALAFATIDGDFSPDLALPAHFMNARKARIMLGPSADSPMGEAKVAIDDVAIYWGALE
jgi:hypothetical protein